MDDYIKREAAIKVVLYAPPLKREINSIPAADVRPVVRGKWITVKYPLYECSVCGAVYQDVGYGFNFCPNCGAQMDGGKA